ncbi:helix-turn-helix domain-containing protein [Aliarcobacter cryaerophilus]|uniref:helix-turn-helix domain-containing protein n=1 Tax=Aliarcobacter cryaerophilus TaxID=28198 RepID=UPI0013DF6670|nr:helix-turn-helix domain-containing protein [Aliarcobacter cryaerophilus]
MEAEIILEKLMLYFNVINYSELAQKIGVAQQNISKWKSRNSVSAIKIKCRELGIYNEIFGDLNHNSNIKVNTNSGQIAGNVHGNQEQRINHKEDEYIIPETILDDINILFKLAIENKKVDYLIELIDKFIFDTKKELRKK